MVSVAVDRLVLLVVEDLLGRRPQDHVKLKVVRIDTDVADLFAPSIWKVILQPSPGRPLAQQAGQLRLTPLRLVDATVGSVVGACAWRRNTPRGVKSEVFAPTGLVSGPFSSLVNISAGISLSNYSVQLVS